MKTLRLLAAVIYGALFAALSTQAGAQSQTAFSYQGLLREDDRLANGQFTMEFRLLDGPGGQQVGTPSLQQVVVADGVFNVTLDFGAVFGGTQYYLQMAVRRGAAGPLVPLTPAQPISPAPLSIFARSAGSVPNSGLPANIPRTDQPAVFSSIIRLLPMGGAGSLRFGPTDDCTIGIDPAFPGLIERDPVGFRLMGQNNEGCRLIFGPTMDCTVEIDPGGPSGLLLRDPRGIRLLSPDPTSPPRLLFGPTDDCSLGIVPGLPGLAERDPTGFRLLGQNGQGCRLIFGPTMACTVEVDPQGPPGLLLRDPRGIRVLPPFSPTGNTDAARLIFGPTDDCSLGIDPNGPTGLLLRDPRGIRILPTAGGPGAEPFTGLRFGPTDDCSIGIVAGLPGLAEQDPVGFRLLGQNSQGCRLIFGPTMDCTVEVQPQGPSGLLLRDPRGIRLLSPDPDSAPVMRFGPTDDCSIGIDSATAGLLLRDPRGIRLLSPDPVTPPVLRFGPTDDCSIGIVAGLPGLAEQDPVGFRLLGQNNQGCRLIFGPTMDCTVEVRPPGTPGAVTGLLMRDPNGIRLLNPSAIGNNRIVFGPTDDCSITVPPTGTAGAGMRFSDPRGFLFSTPLGQPTQVTVNGSVSAQAFIQTSSRRFKDDVKPIERPLEKISKLQGVRFTWSKEKGGQGDLGFIAEEVAKVIPEVVAMEEDGKNARGVNYGHIVAVTVEGIKQQQSQLEKQQDEIATLKKENAGLQDRLSRLEALLEKVVTAETSAQPRHEH